MSLREPDVVVDLALRFDRRLDGPSAARTLQATIGVLEAARATGATKVVVAVPARRCTGGSRRRTSRSRRATSGRRSGCAACSPARVVDLLGVYRAEHEVEHTVLALGTVYGPRQRRGVRCRGHVRRRCGGRQRADDRRRRPPDPRLRLRRRRRRGAQPGDGPRWRPGGQRRHGDGDDDPRPVGADRRPDAAPPSTSPEPEGEIGRLALSPARARIHLAWAPWTDLATGLAALT